MDTKLDLMRTLEQLRLDNPLLTPQQMAAWDRWTIDEFGLPEELLMENASRVALDVLRERFPRVGAPGAPDCLEGKRVLLLAGPGNNGGDAVALARHLLDNGAVVLVLTTKSPEAYKGTAQKHLEYAQKAGVPFGFIQIADWLRPMDQLPEEYGAADREGFCDIIVDGLLGTGFSGELRDDYKTWVQAINKIRDRAFVLAIDVPSGLDGTTGKPSPVAVRAHATVTMEAAKTGIALPEAEPWVGRLEVRRIAIPRAVRFAQPVQRALLTDAVASLVDTPDPAMHKGTAGRVCIIGGSHGLTGAPVLSAIAALRAGAGLVTIACPGGIASEVKNGQPECMTLPLGEGTVLVPEMYSELEERIPGFDALLLGPGMGRDPESARLLKRVLAQENRPPAVVDADGLFHLSQRPSLLGMLTDRDVLTPHPVEMARLVAAVDTMDESSAMERYTENRIALAEGFAERFAPCLVLKGAGTVVAQKLAGNDDPTSFLCPIACPELAIGGSGDVLAGLIAALLGRNDRNSPPLPAACLGVYWHASTGRILGRSVPGRGAMAREIAHALPQALKELIHAHSQGHHDHGRGLG
ncbi:NAD(P)H-hydrate dehydratase [Oceanidesulfovibrio marinus]|nr:NAD(P)H-hydrate dehydratase [Oceanidesulfovibrio marinus]